jgi:glutathione S-transferase
MIKVHHLNNSRSQRILWALEELGCEYEIIHYTRDLETRLAPDNLKEVHPLGKSPVMEDGDIKIAESGAIIDYLVRTYGNGKFGPTPGDATYEAYNEWMHYAEGSAMVPFLLALYTRRLGDAGAPLQPRIMGEIGNHLTYIAKGLGANEYFVGDDITGADFQMIFVLEAANVSGALEQIPNLKTYLERIHARDGYKRALERGGPYQLGG